MIIGFFNTFLKVLRAVRTAIVFIIFSFINPFVFIIDPSRRLQTRLLHFEGVLGAFMLGVKMILFRDDFSPRLRKGKQYLFVSNHQSMLDISIFYRFCPVPASFIAKSVLFFVPFLSHMLWATGGIPMRRKNLRKAYQDIRKAGRILRTKRSILIFPEGTRSLTDGLGPFKPGFLKLAAEAGVDLVPVAIRGTGFAMKKGSILADGSRPLTVFFGAPVSLSSLPSDPSGASAAVREIVARMYGDMKDSGPA